jgi:hypothetical protein
MLFLFDHDEIHTFWMKNTLIPLDMVFITRDGVVAGVVENAEPETLTSRGVDAISRHVLGVEKQNSVAVTSAMLGVFQHDARTRMEFLDLIKRPDASERSLKATLPGTACVSD